MDLKKHIFEGLLFDTPDDGSTGALSLIIQDHIIRAAPTGIGIGMDDTALGLESTITDMNGDVFGILPNGAMGVGTHTVPAAVCALMTDASELLGAPNDAFGHGGMVVHGKRSQHWNYGARA